MTLFMPMPAPTPLEQRFSANCEAFDSSDSSKLKFDIMESYSGRSPFRELIVGDATYKLRRAATGRAFPRRDGQFDFIVEEFGSLFVGRGESATDAREDWEEKVHASLQQLIRTRPFEMDDTERTRWQILQSEIDVPLYRQTTPIRLHQVGRVRYFQHRFPKRIDWADGTKNYVSLSEMPSRFASLKPNQWFDALVERSSVTGKLERVIDVEPIATLRLNTPEQRLRLLRSLPKADHLPPGDNELHNPE